MRRFIKTNKLEEVTENIITHNATSENIVFYVNKQAAYHNQFNIIDESMSTLGDIKVEIIPADIDSVLDILIG